MSIFDRLFYYVLCKLEPWLMLWRRKLSMETHYPQRCLYVQLFLPEMGMKTGASDSGALVDVVVLLNYLL